MTGKIFVVVGTIGFIICCVIGLYRLENYNAIYYTKVDNKKVEELSTTDDMKYEYTLPCYSKNGRRKKLKFKTKRELREGAYLSLEVRSLGVYSWKEIQVDELPEKVKRKLN